MKLGIVLSNAFAVANNLAVGDMNLAAAFCGKFFVVRNNDKSNSLFAIEIKEKLFDLCASCGIEVAGWLVGENNFRVVYDCASNTDTLFLTAGKVVGFVLGFVVELDGLEGFHSATATFAAANASNLQRQNNVVKNVVICVHEEALENEAELLVAEAIELAVFKLAGIFAVKFDSAFGRRVEERKRCIKVDLPEPDLPIIATDSPF